MEPMQPAIKLIVISARSPSLRAFCFGRPKLQTGHEPGLVVLLLLQCLAESSVAAVRFGAIDARSRD
jgi:hypothetical protein